MTTLRRALVPALLLCAASAGAQEQLGVVILPLKVNRHASVIAPDAKVDAIIAGATAVLALSDFNGDVPARVAFQREGAITTTSDTPCTINSSRTSTTRSWGKTSRRSPA